MLMDEVNTGTDKPEMEFGIEETKDVIVVLAKIANGVDKSLEDGEFTITDAFNFTGVVTKLPAALSGLKFVPAELGNLDDSEIAELVGLVKEELDIADDEKVKAIIDKALIIVLAIKGLIESL